MGAAPRRALVLALAAWVAIACAAPDRAAPPPAGSGSQPASSGEAASAAAPAPAAAPARQAFRLAYPNLSMSYLPILLAREQGYYQEEGLDAELLQTRANVGQAALVSGEIDYTAAIGSNVKMGLQGAPIKTFLLFVQAQVMSLVAQPHLRTPEQLRGRTIGVGAAGATIDQVARLMVKHYGLEPQQDVSIVPVGDGAVQYQALQLGQVDAVVMSLPFPVLARREGYAIVANAYDLFKLPSGGVSAMENTLTQRRDMTLRVARAQVRALRYVHTQPEAVSRFIEQFFDMDPQTARESYEFMLPAFSATGAVDRESMELQITMEKAEGTVSSLGYEQLVDPSIAAEVARELGLRP